MVSHEDIIPDFEETATVTARPAIGATRGNVQLKEDFRVGATGAGFADRPPPVIRPAQGDDAFGGDTQLRPDAGRFFVRRRILIAREDGHPEPVRVKLKPAGQKFQAHFDGFGLEVIPQRPVAQHLKEGQMGAVPHFLDVAGAQAGLQVDQPPPGRMRPSGEVGDQRLHSGGGEQSRGIAGCGQGGMVNMGVPLLTEKLKVFVN